MNTGNLKSQWSPSTIASFDQSSLWSLSDRILSYESQATPFTPVFKESSNRPDLEELLRWVRHASPYYRNLYSKLPKCGNIPLCDYPVADLKSFWAVTNAQTSQVLTMPHLDGIIFKTGGGSTSYSRFLEEPRHSAINFADSHEGTTGEPKIVFYTKQELQIASQLLALGIHSAGLRTGDRIANLFHAGDLWGGFLLHVLSIMFIPTPAVHLPIGGFTPAPTTAAFLNDFSATVMFAGVTTITTTAEYLVSTNMICPTVRIIMFSGERFYYDQKSLIKKAFPNAVCRSLVYGSMDAGVIGQTVSSGPDEEDDGADHIHSAFEPFIHLEIVPPNSLMPTTEENVPGKLLVTNLSRRLMPIVRYPSGDRGEWVDYKRRHFRLLGRDRRPVKFGMVSIDFTELRECVGQAMDGFMIGGMQVIFSRRFDGKETMTLKIAYNLPNLGSLSGMDETIVRSDLPTLKARVDSETGRIVFELDMDQARKDVIERIYEAKPRLRDLVRLELVVGVKVEFVGMGDFWVNPRTGKIADIFDERGLGGGDEVNNPFEM